MRGRKLTPEEQEERDRLHAEFRAEYEAELEARAEEVKDRAVILANKAVSSTCGDLLHSAHYHLARAEAVAEDGKYRDVLDRSQELATAQVYATLAVARELRARR